MSGTSFGVAAVEGLPEVQPWADLVALLVPVLSAVTVPSRTDGQAGPAGLVDGDLVVVTSKVISKAEGRIVLAADREQAITDQTVRVVASITREGRTTRIVENHQGLVMAAAGVDASNTPEGTVLLLPVDPDASAARLRAGLQQVFGIRIGVVVTDTVGRPWRAGLVDIAIGAAGIDVLDDLRGRPDTHGRMLSSTVAAVADEVASAVELVTGKTTGRPVAVVRGLGHLVIDRDGPGARALNRPSDEDLFRQGTAEAYAEGWRAAIASGACSASPATAINGAAEASCA